MSAPFITPERYLEIERSAEYKSEYFAGEMFPMTGARERAGVSATGLYSYPDLTAFLR